MLNYGCGSALRFLEALVLNRSDLVQWLRFLKEASDLILGASAQEELGPYKGTSDLKG